MGPLHDRIAQLTALFFQRAVLLLVEGETYIQHQHLLVLVAPEHQVIFLELLQAGTGLRECFAQLDDFLSWRQAMLPLIAEQGLVLSSTAQQVSLYLLDRQFKPGWQALE